MIDLKDRTLNYAVRVRSFVRTIKRDRINQDDLAQLVRASGSVGANFIEAIESLSKKDFLYRLRICLKEGKESRFWLKVIQNSNTISNPDEMNALLQESKELIRILSSIIQKNLNKQ